MRELTGMEMDAVSGGILQLLVIVAVAVVVSSCATPSNQRCEELTDKGADCQPG
jgi:hypothetical protein